MESLDVKKIDQALADLGERLKLRDLGPYELVICGGAALIACAMVDRLATRDIDVVALRDGTGLVSPDPFPEDLKREADAIGDVLDLPENWINNGPTRGRAGMWRT